jgi:hypothetical protein
MNIKCPLCDSDLEINSEFEYNTKVQYYFGECFKHHYGFSFNPWSENLEIKNREDLLKNKVYFTEVFRFKREQSFLVVKPDLDDICIDNNMISFPTHIFYKDSFDIKSSELEKKIEKIFLLK